MNCQDDQWFKEKYDPFISEQIYGERIQESTQNAAQFFEDLLKNKFSNICFDITEKKKTELISTIETFDESSEGEENKFGMAHKKIFLKDEIEITHSPYFGFDPMNRTLFIKNVPKTLGKFDIEDLIKKAPGFMSLSLSEPVPNQHFQRYGWITFKTEDQTNYAAERFKKNALIINNSTFIIQRNNQKRTIKIALKVDQKKSKVDYQQCLKLIQSFDSSKGIIENPLMQLAPEEFNFKNLDLSLLYLRRVHSYCYYCGVHCNDERMLTNKCGSIHLRLKMDHQTANENGWELPNWQNKAQDLALQKITELDNQNCIIKGVTLFKDQLAAAIALKVQSLMKSDNGAWPCFYCQKKFKGADFVVKHIDNKHVEEEEYQQELSRVRANTALELYAADKNKITYQAPIKEEPTAFGFFQRSGKPPNISKYYRKKKKLLAILSPTKDQKVKDLDQPQHSHEFIINPSSVGPINYLEI